MQKRWILLILVLLAIIYFLCLRPDQTSILNKKNIKITKSIVELMSNVNALAENEMIWENAPMQISTVVSNVQKDLDNCGINNITLTKDDLAFSDSRLNFIKMLPVSRLFNSITYEDIKCYVRNIDRTNLVSWIMPRENIPQYLLPRNIIIVNNALYQTSPFGVIKYIHPNLANYNGNETLNGSIEVSLLNDYNMYNRNMETVFPFQGALIRKVENNYIDLRTGNIFEIKKIKDRVALLNTQVIGETSPVALANKYQVSKQIDESVKTSEKTSEQISEKITTAGTKTTKITKASTRTPKASTRTPKASAKTAKKIIKSNIRIKSAVKKLGKGLPPNVKSVVKNTIKKIINKKATERFTNQDDTTDSDEETEEFTNDDESTDSNEETEEFSNLRSKLKNKGREKRKNTKRQCKKKRNKIVCTNISESESETIAKMRSKKMPRARPEKIPRARSEKIPRARSERIPRARPERMPRARPQKSDEYNNMENFTEENNDEEDEEYIEKFIEEDDDIENFTEGEEGNDEEDDAEKFTDEEDEEDDAEKFTDEEDVEDDAEAVEKFTQEGGEEDEEDNEEKFTENNEDEDDGIKGYSNIFETFGSIVGFTSADPVTSEGSLKINKNVIDEILVNQNDIDYIKTKNGVKNEKKLNEDVIFAVDYEGIPYLFSNSEIIPHSNWAQQVNKIINDGSISIKTIIPHYYEKSGKFITRLIIVFDNDFYTILEDSSISKVMDFKKDFLISFSENIRELYTCNETDSLLYQMYDSGVITKSKRDEILKQLMC